jgi:hypothetical protein
MNEDPRTEPLKEWNRLARENTENAIVSSMFEASTKSSALIEKFSTWLLVGAATVASFFIINSDKLVPLVSSKGFLVCGTFLCLSCIAGLISKIYAMRCAIAIEVGAAVRKTFVEHLESYEQEEKKIKDGASFWGITLETGVRMERILQEFFKPQPKIVVWLSNRMLKKHEGNPQVGYLPLISMVNTQGLFSILQAFLFLCFLISGFVYAATI